MQRLTLEESVLTACRREGSAVAGANVPFGRRRALEEHRCLLALSARTHSTTLRVVLSRPPRRKACNSRGQSHRAFLYRGERSQRSAARLRFTRMWRASKRASHATTVTPSRRGATSSSVMSGRCRDPSGGVVPSSDMHGFQPRGDSRRQFGGKNEEAIVDTTHETCDGDTGPARGLCRGASSDRPRQGRRSGFWNG